MLLKDGLPRRSFLYAPTEDTSTWLLPYLNADGAPDASLLPAVVAGLGEAGVPDEFMPMVRAKLRQAYRRLGIMDLPGPLQEAAADAEVVAALSDAWATVVGSAPSSSGPATSAASPTPGEAAPLSEAGRRNSASDLTMLQQVHDLTTRLGACCEAKDAPMAEADRDGKPRSCFAYTPSDDPSTWKLPYLKADGSPDPDHLPGAVAAISSGGFRGQKADIPSSAMGGVRAKLRSAYKRWGHEMPDTLREAEDEAEVQESYTVTVSGARERVRIFESGSDGTAYVTLREAGAEFDDATRSVWITPIKPGWGNPKDGFFYPPETLKAAAESGVFNGRKMFANHPRKSDDAERPERDVRDWVATVKESHWDPQRARPRAKVRVYDQQVYDRWKDAPEEIAFSILGGGIARKGQVDGKDARIVESLERIRSVDWVTEAGAGGGIDFAESAYEELDDMDLKDLTLEQLKDARPDLFAAATAPAEAPKEKVVEEATPEPAAPVAAVSRDEFEALKAELAAERAASAAKDNKAETAKVVESMVRETTLPAPAKRIVIARFAEATVGDGYVYPDADALKAAVSKEVEGAQSLVDELTGKKSLVVGVGATVAEADRAGESVKERVVARLAERFAEDMPAEGAVTADGTTIKVSEAAKTVADRMAEKL